MLCYTLFMNKSLFAVLILFLPSLACAQPVIQFSAEMHDFGKVLQGEQLEYSFEFTNRGDDDLVVMNLTTS